MDDLADMLLSYVTRPVKNFTALEGQYDFTLAFETDPRVEEGSTRGAVSSNPVAASDPAPDLFAALQAQLGLKLEQRRAAVDMLIIDRLEKLPIEN
jgi:uncharacterized protein (TIGR03435 family)